MNKLALVAVVAALAMSGLFAGQAFAIGGHGFGGGFRHGGGFQRGGGEEQYNGGCPYIPGLLETHPAIANGQLVCVQETDNS